MSYFVTLNQSSEQGEEASEGSRRRPEYSKGFFVEFVLSEILQSLLSFRMTGGEGLRMIRGEGLTMTGRLAKRYPMLE